MPGRPAWRHKLGATHGNHPASAVISRNPAAFDVTDLLRDFQGLGQPLLRCRARFCDHHPEAEENREGEGWLPDAMRRHWSNCAAVCTKSAEMPLRRRIMGRPPEFPRRHATRPTSPTHMPSPEGHQ